MINALRSKYSLKTLLSQLSLSKSSYFYQQHVFERGDKYASIRPRLKIIFKQNYASYGYRRMKLELADEGIQLSEKSDSSSDERRKLTGYQSSLSKI